MVTSFLGRTAEILSNASFAAIGVVAGLLVSGVSYYVSSSDTNDSFTIMRGWVQPVRPNLWIQSVRVSVRSGSTVSLLSG